MRHSPRGELDALISTARRDAARTRGKRSADRGKPAFPAQHVGSRCGRPRRSCRGHSALGGRGRLLFVSSITGRVVVPLGGAYAASKWALEERFAEADSHRGVPFRRQGHLGSNPEPSPQAAGERAATLLGDDDPYRRWPVS